MKRATRVSSAPLIAIVTRLLGDSLLASTRGYWTGVALDGGPARLGPGVMNVGGIAKAVAAEDTVGGAHRLLVFSDDSTASVHSAMLVGAIRRALSSAPVVSELDPSMIPSAVIASWRRAPSTTATRESVDTANGPSDGRWLWVLVLVLLGAESWLRRERPKSAMLITKRENDRAA
jgi:hypothetical protein